MIPFVNLRVSHDSIKDEILETIKNIIDSSSFVLGEKVEKFERNFADYCEVKHAISVNSGTAALQLSLMSMGIKNNDEVITVSNSFFATAEAISNIGAKPIFVDVDKTFNIDVSKIRKAISNKTKAILPVHLYGHPSNMDIINEISKENNIHVIEDSCQAHGAEYKKRKTGSLGDIGCFSFYPTKNLGALGEGGIITTNNDELALKCKLLRSHGENPKNIHNLIGYNYRMEGIQGAVLDIKLRYLDKWNNMRRNNAKLYKEFLDNTYLILPYEEDFVKHVYHLFVARSKDRDNLKQKLQKKGISTAIHYPTPIHLQLAYKDYNKISLPNTESFSKEILSLPMFPELSEDQIRLVCDSIKS